MLTGLSIKVLLPLKRLESLLRRPRTPVRVIRIRWDPRRRISIRLPLPLALILFHLRSARSAA